MPLVPLLLPFLRNPWLWVAIAGAGFCWWKGYESGAAKLERYKEAQFAKAEEIKTKRAEVTERIVVKYVQVAGKTQVVKEEITKEVVRYVEKAGNSVCLNPEWRRLHDAAARNELSQGGQPPAGPMRAPDGVAR